MGLLTVGRPLQWDESKEFLEYVRLHGVLQFIETYKRVKDNANDDLFWGDEVEYAVFQLEGEGPSRTVRAALCGTDIMQLLRQREAELHNFSRNGCTWHQEYGSWMLEGTPQKPYAGFVRDLLEVETNMRLRRARLMAALAPSQISPTVTNMPLFGVGSFTSPPSPAGGEFAQSSYVPDSCINPHPRFGTLTRNIRLRRGDKVDIRMPLFRDAATPEFAAWEGGEEGPVALPAFPITPPEAPAAAAVEAEGAVSLPVPASPASSASSSPASSSSTSSASLSPVGAVGMAEAALRRGYMASWPEQWPTVHMDAMAFGMGCCCLQVTFQSRDVDESRWMYDQLAGLAPIMLALTAATPIARGRLLDSDARWAIISQSVDDRTPAERGEEEPGGGGGGDGEREEQGDPRMAGSGRRRITKSRYDSISCYLSPETPEVLNDITCEVDEGLEQLLLKEGLDAALARHVAHLFVRDPLVIFDGHVSEVPDDSATDHWENLQSTNWNTMRWKPPPPRDPSKPCAPYIGWRTEFRSMEVQLSDLENAAFTVFIVLVTRVLLVFDLDLRIPLSFVEANMHRAHVRDAVKGQKFFFRNCFEPLTSSPCQREVEEMSMEEIMTGKADYFPGLVPLIYAYLEHVNCDKESVRRIELYLNLVVERATGRAQTNAAWMREFVVSHADYRGDSVVTETIAHDLMVACNDVGRGVLQPPELLGSAAGRVDEVGSSDAYASPLASEKISANCRSELIRRITTRCQRQRTSSAHLRAEERKTQFMSDLAEAAAAGLRDL